MQEWSRILLLQRITRNRRDIGGEGDFSCQKNGRTKISRRFGKREAFFSMLNIYICVCEKSKKVYILYLNTNFQIYRNVNISDNEWSSRLSPNWPRLETLINISEIIFRHSYYIYTYIVSSTWCEMPFEIKLINENIKLYMCIYIYTIKAWSVNWKNRRTGKILRIRGSKFEMYICKSENERILFEEYFRKASKKEREIYNSPT